MLTHVCCFYIPLLVCLSLHGTKQREFDSIFDKNSAILDVPLETFDESRVEPLMPGSTKTELPVFMLDMSACPGGVVPLHIFEMRYRQARSECVPVYGSDPCLWPHTVVPRDLAGVKPSTRQSM